MKCPKCGSEMECLGMNVNGQMAWYCGVCDSGHSGEVRMPTFEEWIAILFLLWIPLLILRVIYT